MVIFHSYVKLPEGIWDISGISGIFVDFCGILKGYKKSVMSSLPPGASLGDRKTPQEWPHLPCRRSKKALQRLHLVVPYLWQFHDGSWQATCRSLAKPNCQMSQLIAMSAMFGREGGGGWPVRRRDKDTVRRSMACKHSKSCLCHHAVVPPSRRECGASSRPWSAFASACVQGISMRYLWDIYGIWYVCFFEIFTGYVWDMFDRYGMFVCVFLGYLWNIYGPMGYLYIIIGIIMIYDLSSMSYFIPFITGKGPQLWFTVIFIIEMDIWINLRQTVDYYKVSNCSQKMSRNHAIIWLSHHPKFINRVTPHPPKTTWLGPQSWIDTVYFTKWRGYEHQDSISNLQNVVGKLTSEPRRRLTEWLPMEHKEFYQKYRSEAPPKSLWSILFFGISHRIHVCSIYIYVYIYMVTFTTNTPLMLAYIYIPYMDPMAYALDRFQGQNHGSVEIPRVISSMACWKIYHWDSIWAIKNTRVNWLRKRGFNPTW